MVNPPVSGRRRYRGGASDAVSPLRCGGAETGRKAFAAEMPQLYEPKIESGHRTPTATPLTRLLSRYLPAVRRARRGGRGPAGEPLSLLIRRGCHPLAGPLAHELRGTKRSRAHSRNSVGNLRPPRHGHGLGRRTRLGRLPSSSDSASTSAGIGRLDKKVSIGIAVGG